MNPRTSLAKAHGRPLGTRARSPSRHPVTDVSHSHGPGDDYRPLASTALDWFQRAKELNPYYAYAFMRYGMCLHWLGRHDEAASSFQRALQLDPNGYYTVAHQGWHCVQLGDWEKARQWFEKSLALKPTDNPIASSYLDIANRRLQEAQPAAPKGEVKK